MAIGLGIDIGAESIKAVQVKVSGGKISVTGALKIPRAAFPELEGTKGFAIPSALGQELTKAGMRRAGCLGLTGRDVVLKYVSTPPMAQQKLKMFIDLQVADRAIPGRKEQGLDGLTYDFRILNVPTGGLRGDMVIMSVVSQNEFLQNVIDSCKKAGITARRMTTSAFGLAQAYLKTQEIAPKETVAVVDVGHGGLEVALLNEDAIIFARNGPGGSRRFDAGLTKAFGWKGERLLEHKHKRVRLSANDEAVRSPQEKQIHDALREGADAVANAIRGSVTFLRTQAKLPRVDYRRTYLCGGGARLTGLPQYLEAKTQRPVQNLDLFNAFNSVDLSKLNGQGARCFDGDTTDMAVALGLALIDAEPDCFHIELTPATVKAKRAFWGKTVFAIAAGVIFLVSLGIPYMNAQKSLEVAEAKRDELTEMVADAEKLKKDFAARVEDNKKQSLKREYYARQARLGPVYLDLWDRLRTKAPNGIMFTKIDTKQGGDTVSLKDTVRELVIQGYYDPIDVPRFEQTLQIFFEQLKQIPGLEGVPTLNPAFEDTDVKKPVGTKGFEFGVQLASPLKPVRKEATPESSGEETTGGATEPKQE